MHSFGGSPIHELCDGGTGVLICIAECIHGGTERGLAQARRMRKSCNF